MAGKASRRTAFVGYGVYGSGDRPEITPQLLLKAYSCGLFPMADSAHSAEIFWVEPEMRGILPLDGFHVPKSLRKTIRRKPFDIRMDTAFAAVMDGCAEPAPGRLNTWINRKIRSLYIDLYKMGHAHSIEAWQDGRLVGGLYGVSLRGAFFGESMFSRRTDASKVCLVHLVEHLLKQGFVLLDTQFITEHLRRFGVIEVPKDIYRDVLQDALSIEAQF